MLILKSQALRKENSSSSSPSMFLKCHQLFTVQISRADLEQGNHVSDMSAETSIDLSDARYRECRICHMGLEIDNHVYGIPIELGCSCKDDLAAAHKLCAETWFRNKGKSTCEICHSVARNVFAASETAENTRDSYNVITVPTTQPQSPPGFCLDRHFLEFCMIVFFITFIIACVFAGLLG